MSILVSEKKSKTKPVRRDPILPRFNQDSNLTAHCQSKALSTALSGALSYPVARHKVQLELIKIMNVSYTSQCDPVFRVDHCSGGPSDGLELTSGVGRVGRVAGAVTGFSGTGPVNLKLRVGQVLYIKIE